MQLDFYPRWFAILMCVNLQTSFLTPPLGCAQFYLAGVALKGYTMMHVYRGIIPFEVLQVIGISLVASFPSIVSYLPALVFGK